MSHPQWISASSQTSLISLWRLGKNTNNRKLTFKKALNWRHCRRLVSFFICIGDLGVKDYDDLHCILRGAPWEGGGASVADSFLLHGAELGLAHLEIVVHRRFPIFQDSEDEPSSDEVVNLSAGDVVVLGKVSRFLYRQ